MALGGTSPPQSSRTAAGSFWARFRADLLRDEMSLWRARFRNRDLEARYIDYLVEKELPKERYVDIAGIITYFAYGVLDILTITQNLDQVLFLRWGLAVPVATLLIALTFVPRFKRLFGYVTIAIMFLFANVITAIILVMQPESAPPYLIGIFFVFIFCSCVQRMDFRTASVAYAITAAVFIVGIVSKGSLPRETLISSIAFMLSFVVIAAGTSYVQELRSRRIWRRDRQREDDAAFIERLLIEATASDRSKNNFLSVVTHELRTPLHQIIGFSEIVQNAQSAGGETDEYLGAIRSAAQQLLSRIAKILRYADATAGKMRYQAEPTMIGEVVDAVVYDLSDRATRAGVRVDASGVCDRELEIDPNHTRYALANLVENAIAATPKGGLVSISSELDSGGAFVLQLTDNGCGMSAAQIESALRPFTQSEDAKTRSMEGVGLGLTLAERIFSDQGAKFEIQSTIDVGTTIRIRFDPKASAVETPDDVRLKASAK